MNEAENIVWHHQKMSEMVNTFDDVTFEFIYIDDGSTDNSRSILRELSKNDSRVRCLFFSRNFGKEAATTAGLMQCRGDAALIIDADGQHPIDLFPEFYRLWSEGYRVVTGIRLTNRGEGFIKSIGSKLFYSVLGLFGASPTTQQGLTDFRMVDRKVIDTFNTLSEHNRVTRNLIDWLGFSRAEVPFHANQRHAGTASYSFSKLLKLAVDGIVKHSTRPLKLIGFSGMVISLVSALALLLIIIESVVLDDPFGWHITGTAILAVFLSFMIGLVLVCQGLLALYIENVYHETLNRPLYVIDEEI